ncbi:DegT/DnrJ/EryC1/StrS family aminotransferase, partial [Pseudomonadota bacterium]
YSHIIIIEDCAHAHGARSASAKVGSLGDMATFSFYPTKNLGALGDAGAVTTSSESLFESLLMLHQYGWNSRYHVSVPNGRNSRIDELQAGVLRYLLPHLDKYNQIRRDTYRKYVEALGTNMSIRPLEYQIDYVAHLAVFSTKNRDDFLDHLNKCKIGTDIHYPILDIDQQGWAHLGHRIDTKTDLQISRNAINEICTIPCHPFLTTNEVNSICNALSDWSRHKH